MSQPVIHLEEYYLEKVMIERMNSDHADEYLSMAFAFDYSVQRNAENPLLLLLTFIVRSDPAAKTQHPQLYNLDLRIQGIFRFDEGLEEQKMQYLARINGGTILYGILRGMLATMTGSFPEGRINLPTVMMEDVVRRVEEKQVSKAPAKEPTPPRKTKAPKRVVRKAATTKKRKRRKR